MTNHPNRSRHRRAAQQGLVDACQKALGYIEQQPGGNETRLYNDIGAALARFYREHKAYSLDGRDGSERGTLTDVKV